MDYIIGLIVFLTFQGNVVHSAVIDTFPDMETCNKVMTEKWDVVKRKLPPPDGLHGKVICVDTREVRT